MYDFFKIVLKNDFYNKINIRPPVSVLGQDSNLIIMPRKSSNSIVGLSEKSLSTVQEDDHRLSPTEVMSSIITHDDSDTLEDVEEESKIHQVIQNFTSLSLELCSTDKPNFTTMSSLLKQAFEQVNGPMSDDEEVETSAAKSSVSSSAVKVRKPRKSKNVSTAQEGDAKESKPKRAPSAYNIFVKENMARAKAENPEAKGSELFKIIAIMWNDHKASLASSANGDPANADSV